VVDWQNKPKLRPPTLPFLAAEKKWGEADSATEWQRENKYKLGNSATAAFENVFLEGQFCHPCIPDEGPLAERLSGWAASRLPTGRSALRPAATEDGRPRSPTVALRESLPGSPASLGVP
jgi:hypothetical protein